MSNKTQLHWRIAFFLWLVVVTTATHMPAMEKSENPFFVAPDKLFHFVSFGILAFACWNTGWATHRWTVIRLMIGWAIFDEITQSILPLDRPFSTADLLASLLGIIASASWMGALSAPAFATTKEKIDTLLSRTIAWFVFCPIAVVCTIGISGVVWSALRNIYQASYAPISLCVGLFLTLVILIGIISVWCNIPTKAFIATMTPKLLFVGTVALLIGFAMDGTEVGGCTIALTIMTIGAAKVWRLTVVENTK